MKHVKRQHLLREGWSPWMIRRSLANSRLVPILPGKYAENESRSTRLDVLLEVGGPMSAASHHTAAWIHRFDGFASEPPPEITVKYGSAFHPPGVHRTRQLDPLDLVVVGDRLTTGKARTLSDLSSTLTRDDLEIAVESALRSQDPSNPAEWDEAVFNRLVALAQWNRPGHAALRAVLAARPVHCRPTGSPYETRVLQAFRRVGLGDLSRQPTLSILDRATNRSTTVFPDFACFETGTTIEVDGEAYHRDRRSAERRRDNLVGTAVRILRFDSETTVENIARQVKSVIDQRKLHVWPDPSWTVSRGTSTLTIRLP